MQPQDIEPAAKVPARRILPDLLSAQVAADRLDQEAEVRASQRRRARSAQDKAGARSRQTEADAWLNDEQVTGREIISDPETSLIIPMDASEPLPVNAAIPEVSPAQPTDSPSPGNAEPITTVRKNTKGKRVFGAAHRRAMRRGEAEPLRPCERWKRHLPEICR